MDMTFCSAANAGGMLGTWFRYKYPHVVDGVVAGSAPIWNFVGEVNLKSACDTCTNPDPNVSQAECQSGSRCGNLQK